MENTSDEVIISPVAQKTMEESDKKCFTKRFPLTPLIPRGHFVPPENSLSSLQLDLQARQLNCEIPLTVVKHKWASV